MESGPSIKLTGIAIAEKGKRPIIYKSANFSRTAWADMVHSFVTDKDFDASRNIMVIVDSDHPTPVLKPLGHLLKTKEFGSRGESIATVEITDKQWGALKRLPGLKLLKPGKSIEVSWIGKFNQDFAEILQDNNLHSCDLNIGGVTLKNIVGVMGAPGADKDPKADVVFVNKDQELIGYTSLKDGTTVSQFQQWGGISKITHPEIKAFAKNLKAYLAQFDLTGVPDATTIFSEIVSSDLKNMVAWGLKYSSSPPYGIENVEFIIQGNPKVTFSNGVATLTAPHIITRNSNDIISGKSLYRPVLVALFRNDRDDLGFTKTRIFAYAAGGRKMHVELTNNGFIDKSKSNLGIQSYKKKEGKIK